MLSTHRSRQRKQPFVADRPNLSSNCFRSVDFLSPVVELVPTLVEVSLLPDSISRFVFRDRPVVLSIVGDFPLIH